MSSCLPATHSEALAQIYASYDAGISSGDFFPLVYPWTGYGVLICFIYLLVPHRNSRSLKGLKYPIWALNAYWSIRTVLYTRARNMAPAFGVGLISSWSVIWTFALLIAHDPQTEFARIESTKGVCASLRSSEEEDTKSDGSVLQDKLHPNTFATNIDAKQKMLGTTAVPGGRKGSFAWQHYPLASLTERLDWTADLFCNFRGMGWNWRISGLAPPPRWVQKQLLSNSDTLVSSAPDTRQPQTRSEVLRAAWRTVLTGYLVLDLLKVIVLHDPYFWGIIDAPAPAFLPALVRASPALTRIYRLLVTLNAIKSALTTIFALAPLFFVGLLGPRRIGARASPWMYPGTFGSFTAVLDRGLAGWWGSWWHQTFRFGFEAPSKLLIARLRLGDGHGLAARLVRLGVAFVLSGSLHAAGSYTQAGRRRTRPLAGPLAFFLLQPVGILAHGLLSRAVLSSRPLPRWVRRTANFVCVHAWFFFTAPLLADDFSRGGLWLFEPVPLSPLRALGLGDADSHWNCWRARPGADWARWHQGKTWWESGWAL